jgi:DNA-directed RNA polymerase subunit RPC12/RpoP
LRGGLRNNVLDMDGAIPAHTFDTVFAWSPLFLGVVIYLTVWLAKRHESATSPALLGTTYACAKCGRRGSREHMVPQTHEGAVSYYCSRCA